MTLVTMHRHEHEFRTHEAEGQVASRLVRYIERRLLVWTSVHAVRASVVGVIR